MAHQSIREVRLIGSRAEDRASTLSDWDFEIESNDPPAVARDLPALTEPLKPLAAQFDRLAATMNFMLILRGPVKVDLLLPGLPARRLPPWTVSAQTLSAIDAHFWDWALWLASKDQKGDGGMAQQLRLMFDHLLDPLGAIVSPATLAAAVRLYRQLRAGAERRFGLSVQRELETEVAAALRLAGYDL
jgi:hypothetical protein